MDTARNLLEVPSNINLARRLEEHQQQQMVLLGLHSQILTEIRAEASRERQRLQHNRRQRNQAEIDAQMEGVAKKIRRNRKMERIINSNTSVCMYVEYKAI